MGSETKPARSTFASVAVSLLLHGALIGSGAWILTRSLGAPDAPAVLDAPELVELAVATPGIELPAMTRAGLSGQPDPDAQPRDKIVFGGGGEHEPRPDMKHAGRGGSRESHERALNLADSVDGLTLDRDPLNRLDRSQVQRLDTADVRRSRDDRRATPNPMELSFLATGPGQLAERRPVARFNPSRGALDGSIAESEGSALGGPEVELGVGPEHEAGGSQAGSERDRTGAGLPNAPAGKDFRRSAAIAMARPMVKQGRAAVPAPAQGRPSDTLDSSQEVASAVASLIHASSAGGPRGTGPGGQTGPGAVGSGGQAGPGSRSSSNGYGPGAQRSQGDPRFTGYARGIERRVQWGNAFPEWAIAEGRSGVARIGFAIGKDGSVSNVRVVRSSGIPEFDANLVRAVRSAAPFEPPPAAFGRAPLELTMTFDALNPAVGREGPGQGRRR